MLRIQQVSDVYIGWTFAQQVSKTSAKLFVSWLEVNRCNCYQVGRRQLDIEFSLHATRHSFDWSHLHSLLSLLVAAGLPHSDTKQQCDSDRRLHCALLVSMSGSPPGSYTQDIPVKVAASSPAAPPTLPPQLMQVILNMEAPLQVLSAVLKLYLNTR